MLGEEGSDGGYQSRKVDIRRKRWVDMRENIGKDRRKVTMEKALRVDGEGR